MRKIKYWELRKITDKMKLIKKYPDYNIKINNNMKNYLNT